MGNGTLDYLSNRPLTQPCHTTWDTTRRARSGTCAGFAVSRLNRGDLAVTWGVAGWLHTGDPLDFYPGKRDVINGHPALVWVAKAIPLCRRLGGQTSISARIVPTHFRDELYVMDACIAATPGSSQARQVLASAHTFR